MSIENEIASLTQSTTGLLTAVNTKKAILDTAVTNAEAAATDSTAQAVTSTSAKNSSEAARDAAVVAKNAANTSALNAAAVVTGGTATVAPQAGKIPLADSEGNIADGWLAPESKAMGKSEFFALAEKRIRDNAGSGFEEWGNHGDTAFSSPVNEGIWLHSSNLINNKDRLHIGRKGSNAVGVSRNEYPLVQVHGIQLKLEQYGSSNSESDNETFLPKFPPAPDGTKTYDSATGVVVTHASAAEAFSGSAGIDYTTGNWGSVGGGVTAFTDYLYFNKEVGASTTKVECFFEIEESAEYTISFEVYDVVGGDLRVIVYSDGNADGDVLVEQSVVAGHKKKTFIPLNIGQNYASEDDRIAFYAAPGDEAKYKIRNIQIQKVTTKVITSRQDFGFLESFHEKISDKDVVYPLGNVQYGATTWEGISLSNSVAAQGYSAFGEWDTATTGRGVVWSTLSAANKAKFIEDSENNIYSDGDDLIQVRYRVRVVEGVNDNWENASDTLSLLICNTGSATRYVSPRGYRDGAQGDLTTGAGNNSFAQSGTLGNWKTLRTNTAHNGLCFAIPLFLVQRRNQGAYHPVWNAEGCTTWWDEAKVASSNRIWYGADAHIATSSLECFDKKADGGWAAESRGDIATGVSGRPDSKFFDAIYASDVQDLRMSSKSLPLTELREKYKRMAIAGEVRGFEAVPFTKVYTASLTGYNTLSTVTDNTASNLTFNVLSELGNIGYVEQLDGSYIRAVDGSTGDYFYMLADGTPHDRFEGQRIVLETKQTHKQANPTWTDIIGSPANIAATFPNGVEGQWIPWITDGSVTTLALNRKGVTATGFGNEITQDNGTTWTASNEGIDDATNKITIYGASSNTVDAVSLFHYETQAHSTEDAVNSEVLDLGSVWATSSPFIGTLLAESLIGKVPTSSTGVRNGEETLRGFVVRGGLLQDSENYTKVTHSSSMLGAPTNDSPTVKTLDYLASQNGVATLNYAYKEMVYDSGVDAAEDAVIVTAGSTTTVPAYSLFIFRGFDNTTLNNIIFQVEESTLPAVTRAANSLDSLVLIGGRIYNPNGTQWWGLHEYTGTGWGDNNQFEITNNQTTQTDDNGNTVKYGTASFNTQYFVVEE